MLYRLIILTGPEKNRRITVTEEPMTIGRDASCAVVLDDPEVARKHAVLEHRRDGLLVKDLGSMNRTLVNQREVRESHLKHGDMIEIGRTRLLVQALVQADVAETPRGGKRRALRVAALAAVAVVAIAGGYVAYLADWENLDAPTPDDTANAGAAQPHAAPSVTNEELQRMKQDLEAMTRAVRQLAERRKEPEPIVTTVAVAVVAAPLDPIRAQSEAWLADAKALVAQARYDEADALLNRIQVADPDFLPAYEERARLYERLNMLDKAVSQWSRMLKQSTETPEYAKAMTERARLGQELQKKAAAIEPVARIGDIRQRRFPATDDYDEMRIFDIPVEPARPGAELDDRNVRVEVWFFDAESGTGRVLPSRAIGPSGPLVPETENGASSVTATYVVPKGFRHGQPSEHFHGYVVRLYYDGELQDVSARPRTLVETEDADAAAPSRGLSNTPPAAATNQPT
jgi:tetratricopeptide (TPR) repeat protein